MRTLEHFNKTAAVVILVFILLSAALYFTDLHSHKLIIIYFVFSVFTMGSAFFYIRMHLKKRTAVLKQSTDKEQAVIRELSMLTELVGFITSELKFEAILDRFLEMTKILMKTEHSMIFIFENDEKEPKVFRTTLKDAGEIPRECINAMIQSPLEEAIKGTSNLRINKFTGTLPNTHFAVKNILAVSLFSSNNKLKALLVTVNKHDDFSADDEDILFNFAFQAFQTLIIHEELAERAITDGLTGLSNHKAFQEALLLEIERAKRYEKTLPLILLDIDHFKFFNDTYGHQTGDRVLKELARLVKSNLRAIDFPARYGGEEFVIFLPETGYEGAIIVAERIRQKVSEFPFVVDSGETMRITISAGVACYPLDAVTPHELIAKSDEAMYYSKEHGRNRVTSYQQTLAESIKDIPKEIENVLNDPELKNVEQIAKAVDSKSAYTKDHSIEVATYAVMLGNTMKLEEDQMEILKIASILHDIGNIGVPDHILNKPGPLTPEEKNIVQGHPGFAEMILKKFPHIEEILPAILYHHERYDGAGYPDGLKGSAIPLLARIIAIVEAYHAMVSPRPYRRRKSKEEAIEEIKKESGSQFDPGVVESFVKILEQETNKDHK